MLFSLKLFGLFNIKLEFNNLSIGVICFLFLVFLVVGIRWLMVFIKIGVFIRWFNFGDCLS